MNSATPATTAAAPEEFAAAARLLVAFNTEYDDPAPDAAWLARHLADLAASGDMSESDKAARHVYEKRGFDCHEGRGEGPLAIYYELDLG